MHQWAFSIPAEESMPDRSMQGKRVRRPHADEHSDDGYAKSLCLPSPGGKGTTEGEIIG